MVKGRIEALACGAILAGYLGLVVVPASRNPNTNGFAAYYTASRTLLESPGDLARVEDERWFQARIDQLGFNHVLDIFSGQPPTASLTLGPLAWLAPSRARMIWVWLSVLGWWGGLAVLAGALGLTSAPARTSPVVLLGALSCAFVPIAENLHQGQLYLLMFLLLCVHFALMIEGGKAARLKAGVPLGLLLILKAAGGWLLLLLLLCRQWRTVLAAIVTAVAVGLGSLPFIGVGAWRSFLHDLPPLISDPVQHISTYQTVASLMGHLLVGDPQWNPLPIAHHPWVAFALAAMVTMWAAAVSVRRQRLQEGDRGVRALSLAMFGALVVSLAPLAESYHYVLILPAVIVAWWWAVTMHAAFGPRVVLAVATLLVNVPHTVYDLPALQRRWWALLAYPRLYGAFVLWAWLLRALERERSDYGTAAIRHSAV
jgi:hypothetical protein